MPDWNLGVSDAIALQQRLRDRVERRAPEGFAPRLIAGADISMERHGDLAFAGIVVLDAHTMETVDTATAVVPIGFPYVPGLLSFRELPAVQAAWDRLERKPDVLIFDGVGYAHPRRIGLASHGGLLLDVPSVGCAKSILVGRHGALAAARGSTSELVDRGEVVGMAVRLRDGVKPVYVSAGHRMDLPTAVSIVEAMGTGYREPETTRRAHRLVNELRRSHAGVVPGRDSAIEKRPGVSADPDASSTSARPDDRRAARAASSHRTPRSGRSGA